MTVLSFDIGIKNLAFCELADDGRIQDWGIINMLQEDERCKDVGLDEMCMRILDVMNERFHSKAYTHVLLENQPVMKNPVMKSVQMILYTFFQMEKMMFGSIDHVKLISARNKLGKLKGKVQLDAATEARLTDMAEGYRKNKVTAIAYMESLLQHHVPNGRDPCIQDTFANNKKRDDLSDAFLQAWTFSQI